MKTFLKVILFFASTISLYYKGQVSDTLTYIKSFEINKTEYINQPLSKLLNNMTQLQPKSIWSGFLYNDSFNFSDLNFCNVEDSFNTGTVNMIIYWQTPISSSDVKYYENKNNFHFTNDERNFYGNKIVKNIYVYTTK